MPLVEEIDCCRAVTRRWTFDSSNSCSHVMTSTICACDNLRNSFAVYGFAVTAGPWSANACLTSVLHNESVAFSWRKCRSTAASCRLSSKSIVCPSVNERGTYSIVLLFGVFSSLCISRPANKALLHVK